LGDRCRMQGVADETGGSTLRAAAQ